MKRKIFLSLVTAFFLASEVNAQFPSSENVYYYQYVKTVNDGITSKLDKPLLYVVNFQNNMMGYVVEKNIKQARQRILENPDYYKDRAIEDLADSYNRYKSGPPYGTATMGPAQGFVQLIKYCESYSTGSKYTYRLMHANAVNASGGIMYSPTWGKLNWRSRCWSFSHDRSEMIIWSTDDTENRDYYKLINASSLKPNTDFLE